jgi:hypothetical protein
VQYKTKAALVCAELFRGGGDGRDLALRLPVPAETSLVGNTSDLMTTGTAPDVSRMAPMSI